MKDYRFVVRMNTEKKDRRKDLAKKAGYVGLSTVIEELLKLWEKNPNVLDEIGIENDSSIILDSIKGSFSEFSDLDNRLDRIERSLEQIKTAINLKEPDHEYEAVFEEE